MDRMTPVVSVLLTSYNRPRYLAQAVESVFAQTMTDWELIILDDSSAHSGVTTYLGTIWDHPQVIIHKARVAESERAAKCRYAANANTGLKLASGRYITYLCDDDWYAPQRLEVMAAKLDSDPSIGVVYGLQAMAEEDGTIRRDGAGNVAYHHSVELVMSDAYCRVNHSSFMHTAEAGVKSGGWDESPEHWAIGDAAFFRRLNAAGYAFHLAESDGPLDFYRDHGGGVNRLGGPY